MHSLNSFGNLMVPGSAMSDPAQLHPPLTSQKAIEYLFLNDRRKDGDILLVCDQIKQTMECLKQWQRHLSSGRASFGILLLWSWQTTVSYQMGNNIYVN